MGCKINKIYQRIIITVYQDIILINCERAHLVFFIHSMKIIILEHIKFLICNNINYSCQSYTIY